MSTLLREGLNRAGTSLKAKSPTARKIVAPETNDELWEFVRYNLGIEIPRVKVCDDHVAPFTAFSSAFFARGGPIHVWKASRGFGGKSFNLAALSMAEAICRAKVNLLGGSGEQAERVLDYMNGEEVADVMWLAPNAPRHLIKGGFEKGTLKRKTELVNGGYVRALMASTRSVRGPHPERLRLDEIDEMDLIIFDAAMGQTMSLRDIPAHTVGSSTWHNANGTMTEVLKRAEENGWPLYEWCYKENLQSNGGWLPDAEVDRKKIEVSHVMFKVEYDLQEPNPADRAIQPESVEAMFKKDLGVYRGHRDEKIQTRKPTRGKIYIHGTDWAKRTDWTIILTYEDLELDEGEDGPQLELVEFLRTGRHKWPRMVAMHDERVKRYAENSEYYSCHDETGIGDVVTDYMSEATESLGIWMSGRLRTEVLTDYVAAVEHGFIVCPDIEWMRKEHEYASVDDLFTTGSTFHLPDTIAAAALAYHIFKNRPKKRRVRATWGR